MEEVEEEEEDEEDEEEKEEEKEEEVEEKKKSTRYAQESTCRCAYCHSTECQFKSLRVPQIETQGVNAGLLRAPRNRVGLRRMLL